MSIDWKAIRAIVAGWSARLFPHNNAMRVTILVFVGIFLIALATRIATAAEVRFEAGSAVVRGETPTLGLTVSTPGPLDTSIEAGFNLVGSSTYPEGSCTLVSGDSLDRVRACSTGRSNPNQIFLHATLVDGFGPVDVGLGIATMQNEDAYNSGNIQFTLLLRWNITSRLSLGVRHFSNSGTSKPNTGRDLAVLAWRF